MSRWQSKSIEELSLLEKLEQAFPQPASAAPSTSGGDEKELTILEQIDRMFPKPVCTPFTRQDEKPLFKQDADPNFLRDFRMLYQDCTDSCTLQFQADVVNIPVNEIMNRKLTTISALMHGCYDTYKYDLKLPDMVRKVAQQCNSDTPFLIFLANLIADFQWERIMRENPGKYQCAVCVQNPAVQKTMVCLKRVLDGTYNKGWCIHMMPCIPICENEKCRLIASRCMDQMYDTLALETGTEALSSDNTTSLCAQCGRCEESQQQGTVKKQLTCARCHVVTYCNAECQKAHWPKHKKACKLVTCQKCGKLETNTYYSKCSKCQKVFYCSRDCQVADWAKHKKNCAKG